MIYGDFEYIHSFFGKYVIIAVNKHFWPYVDSVHGTLPLFQKMI